MTARRTLYHILPPSLWPITCSLSILILLIGLVSVFQEIVSAGYIILLGLINTSLGVTFWYHDIIQESLHKKKHTNPVSSGLRLGFILFLVSEVMLFGSFFGSYFYVYGSPTIEIGLKFPPELITAVSPYGLSLLNTLLLLASGYTLTVYLLGKKFSTRLKGTIEQYKILKGMKGEITIVFICAWAVFWLYPVYADLYASIPDNDNIACIVVLSGSTYDSYRNQLLNAISQREKTNKISKHIKGDWLSTIKYIVTKLVPCITIILTKIVSYITKIFRNLITGVKLWIKKFSRVNSKPKHNNKPAVIQTDWTIFLVIMGIISFILGGYYGHENYKAYQDETQRRLQKHRALWVKFNTLRDDYATEMIRYSMYLMIFKRYPDRGTLTLTFKELLDRLPDSKLSSLEGKLDKAIKIEGINNKFKLLSPHAQNLILYNMREYAPVSLVTQKVKTFAQMLHLLSSDILYNQFDVYFQEQLKKISQARNLQLTLRRKSYNDPRLVSRDSHGVISPMNNIGEMRGIYECTAIMGIENAYIYQPLFEEHLGKDKDLNVPENLDHALRMCSKPKILAIQNSLDGIMDSQTRTLIPNIQYH